MNVTHVKNSSITQLEGYCAILGINFIYFWNVTGLKLV